MIGFYIETVKRKKLLTFPQAVWYKKIMDAYISQYMSEIGKKGGNTTLQRKGKAHFKEISQLGVAARKKKKTAKLV